MAVDWRVGAMTVLRISFGIFFITDGFGKLRWLFTSSVLAATLEMWLSTAPAASRWYLEHVAIPGVPYFARLVSVGEVAGGLALLIGLWTPIVAGLLFLMVLNFHLASGLLFKGAFLTDGYGLPMIGSLLALTLGGGRLPWSLRRSSRVRGKPTR